MDEVRAAEGDGTPQEEEETDPTPIKEEQTTPIRIPDPHYHDDTGFAQRFGFGRQRCLTTV